jgi:hypothetical protein
MRFLLPRLAAANTGFMAEPEAYTSDCNFSR